MDEQNVKSSGAGLVIIIVLGVLGFLGLMCLVAVGVGLLLPAVSKVREAAARSQITNSYKQIAISVHNFHETHDKLPAHAHYAEDDETPLLSWRVSILPFIEQGSLYERFKLDEPWDGPSNKSLVAAMPRLYSLADAPGAPPDQTHVQYLVGGGALFSATPETLRLQEVPDGTSHTILFVEAAVAVPWSKPADIDYDPKRPLPAFGLPNNNYFLVAMADGSVRAVPKSTPEATIRAIISKSGGEEVPDDF